MEDGVTDGATRQGVMPGSHVTVSSILPRPFISRHERSRALDLQRSYERSFLSNIVGWSKLPVRILASTH